MNRRLLTVVSLTSFLLVLLFLSKRIQYRSYYTIRYVDKTGKLKDLERKPIKGPLQSANGHTSGSIILGGVISKAQNNNAGLWNDPSWRATRFNEAYLQVEQRYGRFFLKVPQWPPEKAEAFKRVLANQNLALLKAGMVQVDLSASSTPLDSTSSPLTIAAAQQQENAAYLGVDDYATFQDSEKIEIFRESVEPLVNAMRSKGVSVDRATEDSITIAYANVLAEVSNFSFPTEPASSPNDAAASQHSQQIEASRKLLMRNLATFLNEQQLNAFMTANMERDGGG